MIDGVKIKNLKVHEDYRGKVMEILRSDDKEFIKFGQVYMTTCVPGVAKAWHYHRIQTDSFACIKGKVRLALFDSRPDSKTKGEVQEFLLSIDENPILVQIPNGVYHGFECASDDACIIVNTPTEFYNHNEPDEYRLPFDTKEIPFKWNATKGG
ncbi:MAG: dTDP-4-dehydrorhamnose 3,5-epimerase [bacterium]|nr:dTDP-4-dehydrorhamnose 3,5-epimerase [bacterium]